MAFIAGSFAAVLLLASVVDPDLFLHFEITPHRTVLFYLTVFGSLLAVARGMIPEENRVFDPELLMSEVVQYTHYMPDEWRGLLHSKKVHAEFGTLFQMKVLVFAQELASVLLTPFVLWYSLPTCAPAIVDFFREFTLHVDGLGYVCSFAVFDFQRHGNVKVRFPFCFASLHTHLHGNVRAVRRADTGQRRALDVEGGQDGEELPQLQGLSTVPPSSLINPTHSPSLQAAHPEWTPNDPSGSLYLSRMADLSAAHPIGLGRRRFLQRTPHFGGPEMDGTVQLQAPGPGQSQLRRRGMGASMAGSVLHPAQLGQYGGLGQSVRPGADSMLQSTAGGGAMAQTAVLGDSQGSIMPLPAGGKVLAESVIPEEDLAADGGVGSELGESYVDGRRARASTVGQSQQEDEDDMLEDGGVLGLLAQIYGTGANLKGRGRGPPRAI